MAKKKKTKKKTDSAFRVKLGKQTQENCGTWTNYIQSKRPTKPKM